MEETLIYRDEVTAILIALADIVTELRKIRGSSRMGKRKSWDSEEERLAWEAHVDETIRNLRELAAGRAEREARARREAAEAGERKAS